MDADELYKVLECSLSNDRHYVKEPIVLSSCGHNVCKSCLPQSQNSHVKCNICGTTTERDFKNDAISLTARQFLKLSLENLFKIIESRTTQSLNQLKSMFQSNDDLIDTHIGYIKEEIDIRIESIKIELDKICSNFKEELECIRQKLLKNNIVRNENIINTRDFEKKLNALKNDLNDKLAQNEEKFYEYQEIWRNINSMIAKMDKTNFKLSFDVSTSVIDKSIVGRIQYEEVEKFYIDKFEQNIKENSFEEVFININPNEILALPNNYLVLANWDKKNLKLYDQALNLVKTIDCVSDKPIQPYSITLNDANNTIYISNLNLKSIMITDLEFNYIDSVETTFKPNGIYYHDNILYVCDYDGYRIYKFSSDLKQSEYAQLDIQPWKAKLHGFTIAIDCWNARGVYFYDLNNFNLKSKHTDNCYQHFLFKSLFYGFNRESDKLFCYNSEGELLRNISVNWPINYFSSQRDGCGTYFHDFLVLSSHSTRKLLKIAIK